MNETTEMLTPAMVALRLRGRVLPHHVQRWCDRSLFPYTRVGRVRLIAAGDLDAVRAVARERGLLDDAPTPEPALVAAN